MADEALERFAKRARWRKSQPSAWQQDQKRKRQGYPSGIWGKFLTYCQENPEEWLRSHPLARKQHAMNTASEIRKGILLGERAMSRLPQSKSKGSWEATWGFDEDDNKLEHWFVWARWVPKRKGSRSNGRKESST